MSLRSSPVHGFFAISITRWKNTSVSSTDGADQQRDEHRVARVEVGDVGELVRDDALELLAVERCRAGPASRRSRRGPGPGRPTSRWGRSSRSRRPSARATRPPSTARRRRCRSCCSFGPASFASETSRTRPSPENQAKPAAPIVTTVAMPATIRPPASAESNPSPIVAPIRNPVTTMSSNRTATSRIDEPWLAAICWWNVRSPGAPYFARTAVAPTSGVRHRIARAADVTSRTPARSAVAVPSTAAAVARIAPTPSSPYGTSRSGPFHGSSPWSRETTGRQQRRQDRDDERRDGQPADQPAGDAHGRSERQLPKIRASSKGAVVSSWS